MGGTAGGVRAMDMEQRRKPGQRERQAGKRGVESRS